MSGGGAKGPSMGEILASQGAKGNPVQFNMFVLGRADEGMMGGLGKPIGNMIGTGHGGDDHGPSMS